MRPRKFMVKCPMPRYDVAPADFFQLQCYLFTGSKRQAAFDSDSLFYGLVESDKELEPLLTFA